MTSAACAIGDQLALRQVFNAEGHVFSIPVPGSPPPGQERWILAVAGGFVTTGESGAVNANCPWKSYYRRALTLFYDVTNLTGPFTVVNPPPPPPLLAAAIGPRLASQTNMHEKAKSSSAVSVRTVRYGSGPSARTWAFVADLLGRILMYDVSLDRLDPSGPPTLPMPCQPTLPLLVPDAIHVFPTDPYDGWRPNVTHLEIDESVLYCATVRRGVDLLSIGSIPAGGNLPTFAVLDTPGIATGIEIRKHPANVHLDQMLVGDNRCGMRLYARYGQ